MLLALMTACGLLVLGLVLRSIVAPLRWLFIPASVVGGLLGLLIIQTWTGLGTPPTVATDVVGILKGWPGPLLAMIFAAMLLDAPHGKRKGSLTKSVLRQGIMVWIIGVGESVLGLLAVWLIIQNIADVPYAFGQLIETGFIGGHGTAGAMGEIFNESLQFPAGRDLGMLFATVGIIYGTATGILIVNIGIRRGWTQDKEPPAQLAGTGLDVANNPEPTAFARVRSDVIDPLAMQAALVGIAFAVGYAYQQLFIYAADQLADDKTMKFIGKLPLFLFTLLGGGTLRIALRTMGLSHLVDGESLKRLMGVAMDFLIVAAIASIRLEAIWQYGVPVLILLAIGFTWTVLCLLVIGRRLLPGDYWFELGVINYGMSTGTTAQGMMLLRMVDRQLRTDAAEVYALAAPLSAPFIGGGVITLTLPLLMLKVGIAPVIGVMALVLLSLIFIGFWVAKADHSGTDGASAT